MSTKDAVQRSGMWRDAGVLYSRRYKEMISAINVKNYRQLSRRHAASKCLFIGHGSGGRKGGGGNYSEMSMLRREMWCFSIVPLISLCSTCQREKV